MLFQLCQGWQQIEVYLVSMCLCLPHENKYSIRNEKCVTRYVNVVKWDIKESVKTDPRDLILLPTSN